MIDFWVFVLLGGAIVFLWRRVDRLETALNELAWREAHGSGAVKSPVAQAATPIAEAVAEKPAPVQSRHEAASVADTIAAIAPEPLPVPPPPELARRRFALSFDFEDLFGRLLPIWAGGVALAVAGFFLVRWSIEAGLLTVSVRVILGFLFGLALIAAAEAAYRMERRVADPRVRQALAGAGIATLYASFYLAGSFYGLVGTTVAFLGLATTTAAAIALSFRFGLPSAVLGLVGGFAAPALVGGEEANLPVLTLYLALVAAGLTFTGRRQDRSWLGIASLAGGLGWGALLLLTGSDAGGASIVALGAYLVILGAVLPAFTGGGRPGLWVRIAAAAIAALQLAALVHQGGYSALEWGLYLLLGAALAWFGWRQPAMREANAVAAAVAVFLLGFWPGADPAGFLFVSAGVAAIFAGVPAAQLWRPGWRWIDVAQVCAVAIGLAIAAYWQFGDLAAGRSEPLLALATLALAGLPAMAAWLTWEAGALTRSTRVAAACAAALLGSAGLMATPAWCAPIVVALLVGAVLELERRHADVGLRNIARGAAVVLLLLLVGLPQSASLAGDELSRMIGYDYGDPGFDWRSPLRWLAAAGAMALMLWRDPEPRWRGFAEVAGVLTAYGAAAQVLPADALAWTVALAAIAIAWRAPGRMPALVTALVLSLLWALFGLLGWSFAGVGALAGEAPPLMDWPTVRDALLHIAPLAVAAIVTLALALRRGAVPDRRAMAAAGFIVLVLVHTLYRHGFAAVGGTDFVATGMAQRTAWELLMLGGAMAVLRLGGDGRWRTPLVVGLAAAALAHFAWFTLGIHNPLWSEQAVGPLPLANWLLPAYGAGIGALLLLRRVTPESYAPLRWLSDAALMILVVFLALTTLRHLFSGSILTAVPMSQAEDLLRSVIGIVAAIGFLLWGARSHTRSWRIGSLVLMLLAVLKVFLFDAAGLEGLARIASFLALGFSLIGIGWFYTRQLKTTASEAV